MLLLSLTLLIPPQSQPGLDTLLNQIAAYAAAYRATLPSLTADESITSQTTGFGLFKRRAEARATFRVTRSTPGAPLQESRQITSLNRKQVAPGQQVHLPLTFSGAFGDALEIFFSPTLRPCFDFTLAPDPNPETQQIDFTYHPGAEALPACATTPPGVAGFVRIDPATKHIRHLERTVPESIALPRHLATLAAVDYAPTPVGSETWWLPTLILARVGDGKTAPKAEFTATYTNYHRFTGTIKLLPNITELPPP